MDGVPLLPPRHTPRRAPKHRLDPCRTVFSDTLPHPPIHPPINTLPSPAAPSDNHYDYFSWRHQQSSAETHDVSHPPPVGAVGDPNPSEAHLHLGAWYAFSKGLQSHVGNTVFQDHLPDRRRRVFRKRRARTHFRTDHCSCVDGATCACLPSAHSHWRYPYPSSDQDSDDEPDHDSFPHTPDPQHSFAQSDSDETCDHILWNRTPSFSPLYAVSSQIVAAADADATQGDITAEQAASGMDVQGIPWESLPFSREDYRAIRLREASRRDSPDFAEGLRDLVKEPRRTANFYNFFKNTRRIKCSIVHFQLRNLAWATSKHDVFVMHDGAVVHWDAAAKRRSQILDLTGSGTASATGLGIVQISTMIAKDDLVIAGGFYGEMVAKSLKTGVVIHNKRITYDENAITNAIDIFDGKIMTSSNDCCVRCFDINTFDRISQFRFNTPVNHATRQPDGKMVAVAGDDKPVQIVDGDTGKRIAQLHGHKDFSFATGWHPSGQTFATGSQDRTCRIWDVRNMSQSFSVLGAHFGAVRSLRFSPCGSFLVMAEPRDYIHIFDVNRGQFDICQEIDIFGEIAGIALTPNAEGLFIAVSDRTYSSLIEYERKTTTPMADLMY